MKEENQTNNSIRNSNEDETEENNGYGNTAPTTTSGKLFCIFYSFNVILIETLEIYYKQMMKSFQRKRYESFVGDDPSYEFSRFSQSLRTLIITDPCYSWPRSFFCSFLRWYIGRLQRRYLDNASCQRYLESRLSVLSAATSKTIRLQTLIVVIIDRPIKTCSVKIEGKHPSIDMAKHHEIEKRKRCYFQNQRKDNSRCGANGFVFWKWKKNRYYGSWWTKKSFLYSYMDAT